MIDLESKGLWEKTFNSIPDIVTIQDTDLRIVKINQAGCDILGLPGDEIKGQHCYKLFSATREPCPLCHLQEIKKDFQEIKPFYS